MKGLIRLFLPLCIFSFIAFGITTAVLGVNRSSTPDEMTELAAGTLSSEAYATIREEFDSISVTANACKIILLPTDETNATVYVSDNSDSGDGADNGVKINAKVRGGTLEVYDDHDWDWLGWLKKLFTGDFITTELAEVTVFVPDKVYEHLDVTVNAGAVSSYRISADNVDLDLSAGSLEYTQPEDLTAECVDMNVSAGTLQAYNVQTREYCIDVSAGGAEVYGLSGNGNISVSAGSARAQFAELNGNCEVDVSAGEAVLDIPENSSVKINCDKSAGDVVIDTADISKSVEDGETVTIGGGKYTIDADVSAGDIRIVNSEMTAIEVSEPEHYYEPGQVAIDENDGVVGVVSEVTIDEHSGLVGVVSEVPEVPAV